MEKPSVEDMLRVAKLQKQNLSKLVEKIKANASEMRLYSHQLECLGDHFDMVEANAKRSREVELKENELQKRTKIFEAAKEEAGDLKKLVEECTEELRLKRNQLSARLDTLRRTQGELVLKEKQLGQVKAEVARRCSEARKVQTRKTEMEEEIYRKKKELALTLHKIEESGKQLKTVDEQLEDRQRLMEIRSMELVSKEKELESVKESTKQLILDFELKEKELDLKSKELGEIQKPIEEKNNELCVIHKQHDSIKLLIQERTEEIVAKEKRHEEILEAICKSSSELEDKEYELDLLKNIMSEEKKVIQLTKKLIPLRKSINFCSTILNSRRYQEESSNNIQRGLKKKLVSTVLVKPEQHPPAVPINDTSHQNEAEYELVNEDTLIQDDLSASLAHHEVFSVLNAIPNPTQYVLDLVEIEICVSHQKEESSLQDAVVENLVFLFEELTKLQRLNEPQLQLKATQVATLWKEKIRIEAPRSSLEALAFLLFVVTYGIKPLINEEETALLASSIAHYKQGPTLFHSLDLDHKIPQIVVDLIAKRQHIPAVRLICFFKLKGYSPIDLLKEEIINLRRSTTEKRESQSQADDNDGERLRAILKVVADYKLEIGLPGDLVVKLIRPTNWSVK